MTVANSVLKPADKLAEYQARGLTSKQEVRVELYKAAPGSGITFYCKNDDDYVVVPARASSVVNTLRNVTVGSGRVRLCIVEHFLCAVTLWGLDDINVMVDGPEMPLGNGSAQFWIELFEKSGIPRNAITCDVTLPEVLTVSKGDRSILAVPDDKFSVTYLMDWKHPMIGCKWQSWDAGRDIRDIYENRTFGMLKEHELLGLANDVVSLTDDGFTMPLVHPDEPVRHKLLDLIGDLALCGINPMRIKARFISTKAGHELDVELSRKLEPIFQKK